MGSSAILRSDSPRRLIRQLSVAADESARRRLLRGSPGLHTPGAVKGLYEEVVRLYRVDLQKADRLARSAEWIAERLGDDGCRAQGLLAAAHVAFMKGRYAAAFALYRRARNLYRQLGRELDAARTTSFALQSLIYLGRYRQAFQWARQARTTFEKHGDRLRLARLDVNVANILYRQDRFLEARNLYERAYGELRQSGGPADVAVALRNMAVCSISVNDFEGALRAYRNAREHCRRHRMPLLAAEADYNIAYLHYLRGEYTRAIELYGSARRLAEKVGDAYHRALCDLDQSEMSLELNLAEEGGQLALRAWRSFQELGMGYEAAKALANRAIASSHEGRPEEALSLFARARRLFVTERNAVWPSLTDLYRALVLYEKGRMPEARRLGRSALRFFARSPMPGKAALAELLLARIDLASGAPARSLRRARSALERSRRADSPGLAYQAYFVLGHIHEALDNRPAAYASYRKAHGALENLRGHLEGEELKIAFVKDKLEVYERLVRISLDRAAAPRRSETTFGYIEAAKSRSLADLIAFRAHALPAPGGGAPRRVERARMLRQQLNWYSRRLTLEGTSADPRAAPSARRLRSRARACESALAGVLRELKETDPEFAVVQNAGTASVESIRAALPEQTQLLEYYQAGDLLHVCLLDGGQLKILPLGSASRAREEFRLLQFQISKFRLGADYIRRFGAPLEEATRAHLKELYEQLLAPVRGSLRGSSLVVVPHGFLHYLPFHALLDGGRYLGDDFSITYAPSASVYSLCRSKRPRSRGEALVLGLPDALTPHIADEARAVASSLPNARLLLGREATAARLREYGATARFIHIATHGLFRQDNPMFSSIRLGTSELNLFDLYELDLSAELVTLSGCGTGLNAVVGGDELLGLVRGLLYAGARAVLGTLWDVHDESTAVFMKLFYERLRSTSDKAAALQWTMKRLRAIHPHPYFWAPFVLTGSSRPI